MEESGISVRIGYRDFEIVFRELDTYGQGTIDYGKGKIYISPNQPEDEKGVTLLHEILHGIFLTYGLKHSFPVADEEHLVDVLSKGLASVLVNNPDVAQILVASLTGEKLPADHFVEHPPHGPSPGQSAIPTVAPTVDELHGQLTDPAAPPAMGSAITIQAKETDEIYEFNDQTQMMDFKVKPEDGFAFRIPAAMAIAMAEGITDAYLRGYVDGTEQKKLN